MRSARRYISLLGVILGTGLSAVLRSLTAGLLATGLLVIGQLPAFS